MKPLPLKQTNQMIAWVLLLLTSLFAQAAPAGEAPFALICQLPDYPGAKGSVFPGGLIAAIWLDGRMIRPASKRTIGESYVEGFISPSARAEFFRFLTSRAIAEQPKNDAVPLDGALQIISLKRNKTVQEWNRVLPDTNSVWHQLEERVWALPLEGERPADERRVKEVSRSHKRR